MLLGLYAAIWARFLYATLPGFEITWSILKNSSISTFVFSLSIELANP